MSIKMKMMVIEILMAVENSVCWYGHVLNTKDGHVLRRALEFEVESKGRNER